MSAVAIDKAEAVLAANPNVVAAWAFGSAKGGCVHAGSDLDIGVFFRRKPGLDETTDLLLRLREAVRFEDIDLVVLNEATSLLRFEAISGRPIYCRDPDERAAFVSLAAREYEDDMALFCAGVAPGGPNRTMSLGTSRSRRRSFDPPSVISMPRPVAAALQRTAFVQFHFAARVGRFIKCFDDFQRLDGVCAADHRQTLVENVVGDLGHIIAAERTAVAGWLGNVKGIVFRVPAPNRRSLLQTKSDCRVSSKAGEKLKQPSVPRTAR